MSENKQAYISHVHLKGYKSIRDMEIDLLPGLNIIIGPNGSGKTNFLEFLDYSYLSIMKNKNHPRHDFYSHIVAFDLIGEKIDSYTTGLNKIKHNKIPEFIIQNSIKINDSSIFLDRKLTFTNLQEEPEITYTNSKGGKIDIAGSDYITFSNPLQQSLNQGISVNTLQNLDVYDENDKPTGKTFSLLFVNNPTNLGGVQKLLEESFKNLPVTLSNNSLKNDFELHKKFIIDLAKYTTIQDLKLDLEIARELGNNNIDNLFFQFYINEKWLYWNQISDGTKRLFYILVNVYFSYSNATILLEEPELGIHPDQLKKLMQFLKEQAKEKQIIITTHSPQVLNILSEEELDHIITTRYDAEKGTTMHHLTEEQKQVARNYIEEGLSLGDAWVYSTQFERATEEEEMG